MVTNCYLGWSLQQRHGDCDVDVDNHLNAIPTLVEARESSLGDHDNDDDVDVADDDDGDGDYHMNAVPTQWRSPEYYSYSSQG